MLQSKARLLSSAHVRWVTVSKVAAALNAVWESFWMWLIVQNAKHVLTDAPPTLVVHPM